VYFSYTVYTHSRGGGWAQNVLSETGYPRSSVSGLAVTPAKDGKYKIFVCSTKPATLLPNEQWLEIPAEANAGEVSVLARHYFEGKTSIQVYPGRQQSDVDVTITTVERKGEPPRSPYPPIPSDENVAQRIDFLSNFLIDHTIVNAPGGEKSKEPGHRIPEWYSIVNNVVGKPDKFIGSSSGAGAPDVDYAAGPWKLAPDEALIIQGKFPTKQDCIFANVLLLNKFLQSLDYQHGRKQHYNRAQIKGMGKDGSYTMVLAHADPGAEYNWLDTEGRETGIVFFRYFLSTVEVAQATTKLIKFSEL